MKSDTFTCLEFIPNESDQSITSTTLTAATGYDLPYVYQQTRTFTMIVPFEATGLFTCGLKWDIDLGVSITTQKIIACGGLSNGDQTILDCFTGQDIALPNLIGGKFYLYLEGTYSNTDVEAIPQLRVAKHTSGTGTIKIIGNAGKVGYGYF